jgi:predicted DNA-binding transcriptional regulator AlpA
VADTATGQGGDLIDLAAVAELLSVSVRTLAELKKEPSFPKAFKLNARIQKFSKAAVLAWLASKQEQ